MLNFRVKYLDTSSTLPCFCTLFDRFSSFESEEMLRIVDRLLYGSAWAVKALTFDAHQSHTFFRQLLFGQECAVAAEILEDLQFFSRVKYEPLPKHALPNLPVRICLYEGQAMWPVPGSCVSACLILFYVFDVSGLL